jgi:hypothetical protein
MKSDFYFENVSGDWRGNVVKITDVDWKLFRKAIDAKIGSHTIKLSSSTISGIRDMSVSIGNFNVIYINRLEDDYFRVWMEFRKRTEIKNSLIRNLISKNKPRKNKIKNYWFEDCRKDLICDNREGVLKAMEDFGLFENLT